MSHFGKERLAGRVLRPKAIVLFTLAVHDMFQSFDTFFKWGLFTFRDWKDS